jgi:hypothetical protein
VVATGVPEIPFVVTPGLTQVTLVVAPCFSHVPDVLAIASVPPSSTPAVPAIVPIEHRPAVANRHIDHSGRAEHDPCAHVRRTHTDIDVYLRLGWG